MAQDEHIKNPESLVVEGAEKDYRNLSQYGSRNLLSRCAKGGIRVSTLNSFEFL